MSNFFPNLEQPSNLLDAQAFEANRRGEVTAAQQKKLTAGIGWGRTIALMLGMLIIGGIFTIVLMPAFLSNDLYQNLLPFFFVGGIFLMFLLLMSYGVLGRLSKAIRLSRDITSHAIQQEQGQLVYSKKGYVFEANSGTLNLAGNFSNGLLPGITYQVCYLESSRVLLSATAVNQPNQAITQALLNDILASVNGFSAEDLLANQNGEVPFAQRRRLIPNILFGAGIMLVSLLFIIPFALIPISSDRTMSFVAILFVIALISILPIVGLVMLMKSLLDLLSPTLQQIQGHAHKERRVVSTGKSSHVEYYYTINGYRFRVDYRAYTALIDGLLYRFYYLGRTKKLIAIESLRIE